jgi:hypothetical protein
MKPLLAMLGVLVTPGIAVLAAGGERRPASRAPLDARRIHLARALAGARPAPPGLTVTPRRARELSEKRLRVIPLPPGGNFNGVRWEQARGPIAAAQVEAVLEYNAMCQWVRAQREGRTPETAEAVLALAFRWPQLQGMAVTPDTVVDCYKSHDREIRFAVATSRRVPD